jgi:hypothetical protein
VCDAPGHAVCLAGVEVAPARRPRDQAREFDVVWSVEPDLVRAATDVCIALARPADAELVDGLGERLAPPAQPPAEQLRLAAAIMTRTLAALS